MKELVTFEPSNTIVVRFPVEASPTQIDEMSSRVRQLSEGLDKIRLLADLSKIKNIPPKTREVMTKSVIPSCEKLAAFGAGSRIRVLGMLILKMLPQVKKSKFFQTEAEARAWLAEEK
jgi:hypothetical protein